MIHTMAQLLRVSRGFLLPIVMLLASVFMAFGTIDMAYAQCDMSNPSIQTGANCAKGNGQPTDLFLGEGSVFKRVSNIMLFIIGAIAVIMLIFGGIRYVVSGGDQNQVTAAKNTILYAIIGIVVALLAYAAVNFVTTALAPR